MYLRWRRSLPSWIRVVPVELPGHGVRFGESFVEDFGTLAGRLCDEIVHLTTRRWALFGHSMGALLAFGIVQRLQMAKGSLPQVLFVSGSPAPSQRDLDRFADKGDEAALIADLRKQGGTSEEVFDNLELLRITLGALDADYRVCESFDYRPTTPLTMPMHAFAGRDDDIEQRRVEAWQVEAGAPFSLQWFDGGHFFIRQQEAQVLRALEHSLRQVLGEDRRVDVATA